MLTNTLRGTWRARPLVNVRKLSAFERKTLKVKIEDEVKTVTMSAPKTMNSLSYDMLRELDDEVGDVEGVRAIVLKGDGRAFSAGHNLKEMTAEKGSEYHAKIFDKCNELMAGIVKCPVPVIAAVDGIAAAAGCQLVAISDISVATKTSTFSVPGSSVGLYCSTPGVPLARVVPMKMSSFMLLTGLPITAEEALRAGLISKITESAEDLDKLLDEMIVAIKAKPRGVIAFGKRFYKRQVEMGLLDALEEGGKMMVENLKFKDAQEGIEAFQEKRKPSWTHTEEKIL